MNRESEAGNPYSVEISRNVEDRHWDEFVARCPGGHHEQTSLWARVKGYYGWQPIRGTVSKHGEIVGGFQVLSRPVKRIGKIGYVSRGPLSVVEDLETKRLISGALNRTAQTERISYLVVVPSYPGHDFTPFWQELKFTSKPGYLPPTSLMQATVMLDLSVDIPQIMAGMRKSTRKNIRRGMHSRLKVREGGEADVKAFRQLMDALCRRKGVSPMPSQADFFQNLWYVFRPHGFLRIHIAESDGRPIAAHLAFCFGDTVRIWKVGWDGTFADSFPNELLHRHMLEWASRNGYRYLDLVSVDRSYAEAVIRGDKPPSGPEYGETAFKAGFGGTLHLIPSAYCKFLNPFVRLLVRAFGREIFRLSLSKRFANV